MRVWLYAMQAHRHLGDAHRMRLWNESHALQLLTRFVELVRPLCARLHHATHAEAAGDWDRLRRMVRAVVESRAVERVTTTATWSLVRERVPELSRALREVCAVVQRRGGGGAESAAQLWEWTGVEEEHSVNEGQETEMAMCVTWQAFTALVHALDVLFP